MSKLFFILVGLLPSCNQLMASGGLEVGMSLPLRASTSVRHEPGGFILGYCPSLSLSSLLCVVGRALVWQGNSSYSGNFLLLLMGEDILSLG